MSDYLANWWHALPDGRLQCDLCPRECKLHEGQRGLCFVRQRQSNHIALTTWGRSSGFCLDPIEKKPLHHFYPGSSVLSFGTAGCNLACKFCQNWDISKSRDVDKIGQYITPQQIAKSCVELKTPAIAFTYNDPVIFAEYAIDTADACRAQGIKSVAVTAGYIQQSARAAFFNKMDAANVDLKGFSQNFYEQFCAGDLQTVLDTLIYIRHATNCWLELTTLLIPNANDSDEEITALCQWIARELGVDVPLHFTAFHPDYKLRDRVATPHETLIRARHIAIKEGLHYVYTGNVHDTAGGTTHCPQCQHSLIVRDWHLITHYAMNGNQCPACATPIAGHFSQVTAENFIQFGRQRIPIQFTHSP